MGDTLLVSPFIFFMKITADIKFKINEYVQIKGHPELGNFYVENVYIVINQNTPIVKYNLTPREIFTSSKGIPVSIPFKGIFQDDLKKSDSNNEPALKVKAIIT